MSDNTLECVVSFLGLLNDNASRAASGWVVFIRKGKFSAGGIIVVD